MYEIKCSSPTAAGETSELDMVVAGQLTQSPDVLMDGMSCSLPTAAAGKTFESDVVVARRSADKWIQYILSSPGNKFTVFNRNHGHTFLSYSSWKTCRFWYCRWMKWKYSIGRKTTWQF